MRKQVLTAHLQAEKNCRQYLENAKIDFDSFQRKIQPCSLSEKNCLGMCCYEGTLVVEEDAAMIQEITQTERVFFRSIGLKLPEKVIVDYPEYEVYNVANYEWMGIGGLSSTAIQETSIFSDLEDFPEHFNRTACVFLTDRGQCGLQLLAEDRSLHPWYYKPFICWLHPIMMTPLSRKQILIRLPNSENQPYQSEEFQGFTSYTFCGKTDDCGNFAYLILENELDFLGEIVGRDFNAEIRQYCSQ